MMCAVHTDPYSARSGASRTFEAAPHDAEGQGAIRVGHVDGLFEQTSAHYGEIWYYLGRRP